LAFVLLSYLVANQIRENYSFAQFHLRRKGNPRKCLCYKDIDCTLSRKEAIYGYRKLHNGQR